jgi:hypothetical protein
VFHAAAAAPTSGTATLATVEAASKLMYMGKIIGSLAELAMAKADIMGHVILAMVLAQSSLIAQSVEVKDIYRKTPQRRTMGV